MPQPSEEKEKYTIDEMMGRLKGRDSSGKEPELVTRSDGSQVMKVRKRKRRSNQAVNKETKRNRRVQIAQIAGFVVIIILVGLAAGIGILYANSSGFRDSLLGKLEMSSGAKVEMEQFRMNPVSAHANATTLAWPAGNALDTLEMKTVVANISPSSFMGKTFGGEEIVALSGTLTLKSPDPTKQVRLAAKPDGPLPLAFSRYSVTSLDVSFGSIGSLNKTEASLYPSTVAGNAEIRLTGGLMQFVDWPSMSLDRSYVKVRNTGFQVQSLRFQVPEATNRRLSGGTIDFSGTLSPLVSEGSHTLSAKMEGFVLPYLVGGDLGRFLLGRVDSQEIPDSNFLTFNPESEQSASLELTVTNSVDSRIDLAGFKFLQSLSVAFDDRWYEFPNFDDNVSIVVKRTGGKVEINDINLVSRGRMAVRGTLSNGEAGAISGKLRIGVPETTLGAAVDKKVGKMFGQVREGYRWLELEIGGTGALPEDNFMTLYKDTTSAEAAAPDGEAPQRDSFEDLIEGE